MNYRQQAYKKQATTLIDHLKKRNIEAFYCETKEQASEKALELIGENTSVSWGGSQTLYECGLIDRLYASGHTLTDIDKASNDEEWLDLERKSLDCDYYLMSSNAISLDGQLINIDGHGNRVAALIHGPAHVLLLISMNKVVLDVSAGIARVKIAAASANAIRLGENTPCAVTGVCNDCLSSDCMCCQIVVTRKSRHKGRIQIVLIGEELGF